MSIAAAAALGQTGYGIYQYQQAKKELKGLDRPEYEIPGELQQNLSQAERQAIEGLPAEQKRQYIENIQRAQGRALEATGDRAGGLTGIGGIYQSEMDAYRDLLTADVQARREAEQLAMGQRSVMAGQRAQQWQINQMEPYLQRYSELQQQQTAGQENIWGGVQGLASYEQQQQQAAMSMAGAALSDRRLKTNIKNIGTENGINLYEWDWNEKGNSIGLYGSSKGVIAQEIQESHPEVVVTKDGYLAVHYSKLPISA